jgi:hypothetical protein
MQASSPNYVVWEASAKFGLHAGKLKLNAENEI